MSEPILVKVKPLVWESYPGTQQCYVSQAIDGEYIVAGTRTALTARWAGNGSKALGSWDSVDSAKAACQRDHDSRVLALLDVVKEEK